MGINDCVDPIHDDELISQIAKGDQRAFAVFYDRYKTPLFAYINHLTHQPSASEDVLQEVFIAIWKGASQFKHNSSVKTWLYRIAHNQAITFLRSDKNNHKNISIDLFQIQDFPANEENPENSTISLIETQKIYRAIGLLSTKHRSVIELALVHQFSYCEISEILQIPIGTVKSRMSYAIKYITQYMVTGSLNGPNSKNKKP